MIASPPKSPATWLPALSLATALVASVAAAPDFSRDIRPLFEAHCIRCHGPEKQKGRLRFDTREGAFAKADSGEQAIVPGHASMSPLIQLVSSIDDDERMPPNGKGERLSPDQIAVLKKWIEAGAEWPEASTLVIWGGEFGRMPVSQRGAGRDHNPNGFMAWMTGAGIKGGVSHGETDEIGLKAVVDRVSVHDLHATMLHLLGLDHKKLTYLHNGRRYRLTDVAGDAIKQILV